jgi:Uma2 family endonuclease
MVESMTRNPAQLHTHPVFSEQKYLDFERFSQERHEFLDGNVFAMAGLYTSLGQQLRGSICRGFSPNMKIATSESGLFAYPDLAVVCGTPEFFDKTKDVLTNPVVIFEVLSPSTEHYDRGEKFLRYTNYIESLRDYVLISQSKVLVEHYSKQPNSAWSKSELSDLDAVLLLPSISCEIRLADLYELIDFPVQ